MIYEGHMYGTVANIGDLPYEEFDRVMFALQSFVAEAGHEYSAPFWLGEFGTTGSDPENWPKLIRFLKEHDFDWAYWCLDGYQ